jgi:methylthioribose-1-phosphate isomerase
MKVAGKHYRSIWSEADRSAVHIIDQSRLPHVFETLRIDSVEAMAEAIKTMRLRGAPLIGVAAAYGIALAMNRATTTQRSRRPRASCGPRAHGREPGLGNRADA